MSETFIGICCVTRSDEPFTMGVLTKFVVQKISGPISKRNLERSVKTTISNSDYGIMDALV